jgi:SagB-type dehydrogenase family enzyme
VEQPDSPIHRYHDGTKHHFNRFARSLGYLDWATQPRPFRSFAGSPSYPLYPAPDAHVDGYTPVAVDYHQLFESAAVRTPLSAAAVGDLLRHSLGLSAWKVFGSSRWSLRANPSSGNLHPTEAYVVSGPLPGLADDAAVYHYAPDRHLLEERCVFDHREWTAASEGENVVLIALTSIHWREAWKYGERAFRYCQHDLGHAVAAVSLAAKMLGWRTELFPTWSHHAIAALIGLNRDEDFVDAEREEPGCLLAMTAGRMPAGLSSGPDQLLKAVRGGHWSGRASQLSEDHIQWTFIDDVASATEDPGRSWPNRSVSQADLNPHASFTDPANRRAAPARALMLQRRSALAFDARSTIEAETFFGMLARTMPGLSSPSACLWWTPRIHLLLFVHRIVGVAPGLYVLGRDPDGFERLLREIRRHDGREPAHDALPLVCLGRGDCRSLARRLSCDQDIASDGCFSLGMVAEFDASLAEYGPSFYRHLFWESGLVGQILYLEAEAAGVRSTGIGCFYDDPVHEVLGLQNHAFQSLYHFTVGIPVEDRRLTTERGYAWESGAHGA